MLARLSLPHAMLGLTAGHRELVLRYVTFKYYTLWCHHFRLLGAYATPCCAVRLAIYIYDGIVV